MGAAAAGSVQAEGRMDGLRQVGFLETQGTEAGPWVAWGGVRQVTPKLGFQGSQPTAGKRSGLHLPLPIKWHYLNPASHSGLELAY